jgi:hypothetical protein
MPRRSAVTGNKLNDKMYHHHTGYIGNIKTIPLKKLLATHPERAIEIAVKGMLPKNTLGRNMYPQAACVRRRPSIRTRRSSPSRSRSESTDISPGRKPTMASTHTAPDVANVSRSVTARLNTGAPGFESFASATK